MRVYIPSTVAGLHRLLADQAIQPLSGTAFALTPRLREAYAVGDDEELEYVAMTEAARASLRLLAGELVDDPAAVMTDQITSIANIKLQKEHTN